MRPRFVAPEALQPGGGMALPGAEEMARMGMSPGPLTRGPKRVTEEACPVCAGGQGMCACPGEAMVSPSRPAYVGAEKLAVPGPGEPMGEARLGGAEDPLVGETVTGLGAAGGGEIIGGITQALPAPGGMTAAAVPTEFQVPFGAFTRFMRQPELRVPEARPRFETVVTARGPEIREAAPRPIITVAQLRVETSKVNFNFGAGTDPDATKRKQNAEKFVKALNDKLGGARFGVKFEVGDIGTGQLADVVENLDPGKFLTGPGTYEYTDKILELTRKYGKTSKEPTIKVIVVKGLPSGGTTVGEKMETETKKKDPTKFRTTEAGKTVSKEAIFYNEGEFSSLDPSKSYEYTRPAHEVVHQAGLEDNESGSQKYNDKRLNSYNPDRNETLDPADEKKVQQYFNEKFGKP